MSDPVRAAIYCRVSRDDEEERRILANQVESAKRYCAGRGFVLDEARHSFIEIASGGKNDRPRLVAMLESVERGEVGVVVFTSLSRMTRGGIDAALYVLGRIQRAKCGWHFVEQPILNFDANTEPLARDIILAVLAAVDRDYRRRISTATKKAYTDRKTLALARGDSVRWGRPKGSKDRSPRRKLGTPSALSGKLDPRMGPIVGGSR